MHARGLQLSLACPARGREDAPLTLGMVRDVLRRSLDGTPTARTAGIYGFTAAGVLRGKHIDELPGWVVQNCGKMPGPP